MNTYVLPALGALVLAVGGCTQDAQQESLSPWPTTGLDDDYALLPYLEAIEEAQEPSAVVAAYAQGLAVVPDALELHHAYVLRMVQLGQPHAAAAQARILAGRDGADGLAWAVLAFDNAQAGRMELAFREILEGLPWAKDDPFALATASQLLAWYDHPPADADITPAIPAMASRVRLFYAGIPSFDQAYQQAAAVLAAMPANSPAK